MEHAKSWGWLTTQKTIEIREEEVRIVLHLRYDAGQKINFYFDGISFAVLRHVDIEDGENHRDGNEERGVYEFHARTDPASKSEHNMLRVELRVVA